MPCVECSELTDHNLTIRTFDLYLAEIDAAGQIGEDVLVGNIVTGTFDDDGETFDAFEPLGGDNEPIEVFARLGVRLSFTTDEIACQNLLRMFGESATASGAGDRLGLDPTVRRALYRVTLEHEMPCGTTIEVRFHRASIVSRGTYLFSPDTIHGLPFEIKSLPSDDETNPFGYIEITPGNCAVS
jgi:hypothetical protein